MVGTSTSIIWKVNVYDRRTKTADERTLVLHTSDLDETEAEEISRIIEDAKQLPLMRKFRRRFQVSIDPTVIKGLLSGEAPYSISLTDYFEDENGDEVRLADMSGSGTDLLLGNVQSVLRIGPKPMRDAASWTVENSDDVAHCIELCHLLVESDWYKSNLKLTTEGGEIKHFERAGLAQITSALPFVRQLYADKDSVLKNAYDIYSSHCDASKREWVACEWQFFDKIVKGRPPFDLVDPLTSNELLRSFLYSFGLLHRPTPKQRQDFATALKRHGRSTLVLAFLMTCHALVRHAQRISAVMEQDFTDWVAKAECPPPDRAGIKELLG